jgi:ketosteroid isomerase-like protein
MLRSVRTFAPPAVALALVLAGCGGGDDDEKTVAAEAPGATTVAAPATDSAAVNARKSAPGGVVERYIAAFSKGDGKTVCKLYTAEYRAKVAKSAKDTCAAGIQVAFQSGGGSDDFQQSLNGLQVASSKVTGADALVTLVSTQGAGAATKTGLTMRLRKQGGEWRIAQPDTK